MGNVPPPRRLPLFVNLVRVLGAGWRWEPARRVIPVWAVTRLGVLAVGYFAVVFIGYKPGTPPFRADADEFLNLPARWDAGWYMGIASEGYRWSPRIRGQQNIAFFPALPLIIRGVVFITGGPHYMVGQAVVLVLSLAGFIYFFLLARDLLGDEGSAAVAVALLAAYPCSLFYSAIYTESVFLLGATAALFHVRRRQFLLAAAWGALVGLARPNGFLLSAPIALAAIGVLVGDGRGRFSLTDLKKLGSVSLGAALLAAAAPAISVAAYSAFLGWLTGMPLAWMHAHAAWGRTFNGVFAFVTGPLDHLYNYGPYNFARDINAGIFDLVAGWTALAALWPVYRRFGLAYSLLIAINLLPPLVLGGWLSIGRLVSTLFPCFLWLAAIVPARHLYAWMAGFAALQAFGAVLFYTWRPFL